MKKILSIITLFLICSFVSETQAQGFIRGGGGAGFNVSKDAFGIPSVEKDSNNIIIKQNTVFGSFGHGARFSVAGGYMITPYFGVELEMYYFLGFKQDYGSTKGPVGDQYNRTGFSYQLRATPSLIVQAPLGKFQPYARFGVLIPLWGKTIIEENWNYSNGNSKEKQTDIDGKFSVGFESSIGLQYNITDNLGIYVQATYTGLRIKSDKAVVSKDMTTNKDGSKKNNLENAKAMLTQIQFQDVLTEESNTSSILAVTGQIPEDIIIKIKNKIDQDKPLNLPTQTSTFNSLSFSIGIKYTFNKK